MNKIIKCSGIFSLSCILGFCGTTNVDAYVITAPCSDTSAKVCQIEVETTTSRGSQDGYDEKNTGADNANQEIQQQYTYSTVNQGNGVKVTYANENPNIMSCTTKDGRIGTFKFTNMSLESGIPVDHGSPRSPSSASCIPNNTRTFTSADSPAGTGRAEGDPNVYKGDQINFYVDDGGPYRLEADMLAGHVEIELMPSSYVIEYGNGDTDTHYTAGQPVTTYPRERPRETATSYAYQRSGNFHAYATVHYTARFRVDGGPWQMMEVTPQATSDPLLVRVWWVDVGRVAGDCSYDDTRWGCKNDPTMGKKDNPNPRLRKADIRTGQRWHRHVKSTVGLTLRSHMFAEKPPFSWLFETHVASQLSGFSPSAG